MTELVILKDVIEQNGVEFELFNQDGGYVNGKWVESAASPTIKIGIILPLSTDDLRFEESGSYTSKEKKVLVAEPLNIGDKVKYKNTLYMIQNFKDLTDYTDVHIYLMRWEGVADNA